MGFQRHFRLSGLNMLFQEGRKYNEVICITADTQRQEKNEEKRIRAVVAAVAKWACKVGESPKKKKKKKKKEMKRRKEKKRKEKKRKGKKKRKKVR